MAHSYAPHDFNRDLYSDILWRHSGGSTVVWSIRENAIIDTKELLNSSGLPVDPAWRIPSSGDLNGDLTSDIIWRNADTGQINSWLINNTTVSARSEIYNPGLSWLTVDRGLSYYNGDSNQDILFQHIDGHLHIWDMNGFSIIDSGPIGSGDPIPNWHPRVVGDFNGDSRADVFWQHDDGTVAVWLLNNKEVIANQGISNPGTVWHPVGGGDFNADGRADILWRHDDGTIATWFMNGVQAQGAVVGNPGTAWHPVSVGFYNGDDYSDILWRHDSGHVAVWNMQGNQVINSTLVQPNAVSTDWGIVI
jgi:hypothetical protein